MIRQRLPQQLCGAALKNVELLSSIPGIGFWISMVLVSEIGDFSVFHHPKQLAAYFGLDPFHKPIGFD